MLSWQSIPLFLPSDSNGYEKRYLHMDVSLFHMFSVGPQIWY